MARWPSGRTSDSGPVREEGSSILTQVAIVFCGKTCFLTTLLIEMYAGFQIQRQGSSCMF